MHGQVRAAARSVLRRGSARWNSPLPLLVSCFGDEGTGGGLIAYDGGVVERVDRLSSMGMCVAGDRLARLIRAPDEPGVAGELMIHDDRGVERYFRLDSLVDAHDVIWDGTNFVMTSSANNAIVWLNAAGDVTRSWTAPGEGDCWHLNSLLLDGGDLYVAAFGKHDIHRGWAGHSRDGLGFVMNVETGEIVLSGLDCPHTPRRVDGSWLVCNSSRQELLQFDTTGKTVERRLQLNGFTRGLAVLDGLLIVGESVSRFHSAGATGSLAVVDRATWKVLDRVTLPYQEVYDLVLVPETLLDGVRTGFGTNAWREAEQNQYAMFRRAGVDPAYLWAIGEPLPEKDTRIRVQAHVPSSATSGSQLHVPCCFKNGGSRILVWAEPHPVTVAYRWRLPDRDDFIEGEHWRLPRALPPGESQQFDIRVTVPLTPGEYLLEITLVQEYVRWFDEADPQNASRHIVQVQEKPWPM